MRVNSQNFANFSNFLTFSELKLPELNLEDQQTCLEILRRFYGKHKRLMETGSMSKIQELNADLTIPNMEPENVKFVMNYFANNKGKVYSQLTEDYKEFQRPDILKIDDSDTYENEDNKAVFKKSYPWNIFGPIKVKEKINYVDLFKDFKEELGWRKRLKKTGAYQKIKKMHEENNKMVFDKCRILKKSLRSLEQIKYLSKRANNKLARSVDIKTTLGRRILRESGQNFRPKGSFRPSSMDSSKYSTKGLSV